MVTHAEARAALDSLDDCARMDTGVDAHGPRGVLERYIAQQEESEPRYTITARGRELLEGKR